MNRIKFITKGGNTYSFTSTTTFDELINMVKHYSINSVMKNVIGNSDLDSSDWNYFITVSYFYTEKVKITQENDFEDTKIFEYSLDK